MKKTIFGLLAEKTMVGLLAMATCALANATVIHFDDLSGDETLPIVPMLSQLKPA